jgi:transposase
VSAGHSRDNIKIDYSNREACRACPLQPRCTKTYRHVSRLENEAVLDRMAARLAARPEVLDQRRTCVEHPFGTIKQWMNQGAFLMRGWRTSGASSASRRSPTTSVAPSAWSACPA